MDDTKGSGQNMETGRFVDLICQKRDGQELKREEIRSMIQNYVSGQIPDYQMSAMLMAIYFRGMSDREITEMTIAMRDSGDIVDLSQVSGIKVDKHSTGGVGDKTTLIIGPIVAACGIPVAKMSGRGLGFTGGTLDKLESIPGFRVELSEEEFFSSVKSIGISLIGQTGNLAPADKMLYALRDVTGTVPSIPLIASSIMSKKLAAGSDKILLDVTTGSGAFIKELEESRELARRMVAIGRGAGKETVAMITNMDEPLGYAIGNNLEVKEVIETLKGNGPEDLKEVCFALAGMMLSLGSEDESGKKTLSYEEGKKRAEEVLENGAAFAKFKELVQNQGGDITYIESPEKFPMAACCEEIRSDRDGYVNWMDTEGIGVAAGLLGAGREKKDSKIDYSAGIMMRQKIGNAVKKGDVIAVLYSEDKEKLKKASAYICDCFLVSDRLGKSMKMGVDILR